jgi:hypothetical protein
MEANIHLWPKGDGGGRRLEFPMTLKCKQEGNRRRRHAVDVLNCLWLLFLSPANAISFNFRGSTSKTFDLFASLIVGICIKFMRVTAAAVF